MLREEEEDAEAHGRLPRCAFEQQLPRAMRVIAHAFGLHRVDDRHRRVGAYNILGIDFVVDARLQLHFIEANLGPGMTSHDLQWKERLGLDLLVGASQLVRLIHEHNASSAAGRVDRFSMVRGDRFFGLRVEPDNWWELAFSEQQERCDRDAGREVYHPCPAKS